MRVGDSMLDVAGETPVVRMSKVVAEDAADVFVKLEGFNPTGSYKDRMALAMIEEAERRGELEPGMSVGVHGRQHRRVTGVRLRGQGLPFRVVSSDAVAVEKLKTMVALGAELTIVESEGGKVTPDLVSRMVEQAREYAREPGTYWTDQLNNADSLVGYREVGRELLEQTDRPIDVFCAAAGTAGLTMRVSAALHDGGSNTRIVVFEPASTR